MHLPRLVLTTVLILFISVLSAQSQTDAKRPDRKIEYMVFKGGGVLGMAYAGALEVMDDYGVLKEVKGVAGTSAGALTAMVVALNYNSDEITQLTGATHFKDFEDKENPLRVLSKYGLYEGEYLLTWIEGIVSKKTNDPNTTFGQLADLGFKDLHVYSTDLSTGVIQEFSPKETPDVKVAEAVRASMSIPLFFDAWQFPSGVPNDHIYVDGGMTDNYPLTAFEMDKTLGFYLYDKNNKLDGTLKYDHLGSYVEKLIVAIHAAQELDFMKNEEELSITVLIDNLGISPVNFKLSEAEKEALYNSGKMATESYFK